MCACGYRARATSTAKRDRRSSSLAVCFCWVSYAPLLELQNALCSRDGKTHTRLSPCGCRWEHFGRWLRRQDCLQLGKLLDFIHQLLFLADLGCSAEREASLLAIIPVRGYWTWTSYLYAFDKYCTSQSDRPLLDCKRLRPHR